MKQYLVTITPQEPYFFGNEKSFKFPGDENSGQRNSTYSAASEKLPAASSIMGTLRYVMLPVKKTDFSEYTDEDKKKNAAAVGAESFVFGKSGQSFGVIKEISPLFVINGTDILVPAPFNHKYGEKTYSPFGNYKSVKTPSGEYLYTEDYNSKKGVFSGYMRLSDGRIFEEDEIFFRSVRNGINIIAGETTYRREYVGMKQGFSFGVYLTLDDEAVPEDTLVFMGQKKSVFSVRFTPQENTLEKEIKRHLKPGEIYCLGDAFVKNDIYKEVLFAVTKTRDYRGFSTNYGKVKKEAVVYKTICAGSIFIPEKDKDVMRFFDNPDARKAGYNTVVFKTEDEI